MSANTTPDNITYPVSTDQIAPLETVLATMATSMQTALSSQGKYFVASAASDAARNGLFPVPVQGNRVYRSDLGYEQAYYALYNAASNPGGRAVAGWAGESTAVTQKSGDVIAARAMVTQTGIVKVQGGGSNYAGAPVVFPIAFSAQPVVIGGLTGYKPNGPFDSSNLSNAGEQADAQKVTSSGFTAYVSATAALSTGLDFYVSWIAVGPV